MPRGGVRQGAGRKSKESKNQTEIKNNQRPAQGVGDLPGVIELLDSCSADTPASTTTLQDVVAAHGSNKRQQLRSRLDAYKEEYLDAARRQDWETCTRVNWEREPLFYELWELERGLPPEKQYWFSASVINQGRVFRPELTRKA